VEGLERYSVSIYVMHASSTGGPVLNPLDAIIVLPIHTMPWYRSIHCPMTKGERVIQRRVANDIDWLW
jgi:hypothetical protein